METSTRSLVDKATRDFCYLFKVESGAVVHRPILPDDVSKDSWLWGQRDEIRAKSGTLVVITGLEAPLPAAVRVYEVVGGVRLGNCISILSTSWEMDDGPLCLMPAMTFAIIPCFENFERTGRSDVMRKVIQPIAFRGFVVEERGVMVW
ncbi:MAG: hypothetical protein ABIH46_06790 [Chloroflexota bacterium]